MADATEQLKNTLKGKGFSLTRSRRIIFEALQGQEPQTMSQLIKTCLGEVDPATVYRTVSLFERLGIVQRLQIGWKYQLELSDSFHQHHHHLTCGHCGRVIPFGEDSGLEDRLMSLARSKNFIMNDHQLEIQGLCSNCH